MKECEISRTRSRHARNSIHVEFPSTEEHLEHLEVGEGKILY
jgi:hypothetical protein